MDRWCGYLGHAVNFKTTKKPTRARRKSGTRKANGLFSRIPMNRFGRKAIADAVRPIRQTRRQPAKTGEMEMLPGMMHCADCSSIMYQCRATGFRKDQEYYINIGSAPYPLHKYFLIWRWQRAVQLLYFLYFHSIYLHTLTICTLGWNFYM